MKNKRKFPAIQSRPEAKPPCLAECLDCHLVYDLSHGADPLGYCPACHGEDSLPAPEGSKEGDVLKDRVLVRGENGKPETLPVSELQALASEETEPIEDGSASGAIILPDEFTEATEQLREGAHFMGYPLAEMNQHSLLCLLVLTAKHGATLHPNGVLVGHWPPDLSRVQSGGTEPAPDNSGPLQAQSLRDCGNCGATGMVIEYDRDGIEVGSTSCPSCEGTGEIFV